MNRNGVVDERFNPFLFQEGLKGVPLSSPEDIEMVDMGSSWSLGRTDDPVRGKPLCVTPGPPPSLVVPLVQVFQFDP
jgi:hypothetical protein